MSAFLDPFRRRHASYLDDKYDRQVLIKIVCESNVVQHPFIKFVAAMPDIIESLSKIFFFISVITFLSVKNKT